MVKVVFLHPDLGVGGAERLVVDAALALKSRGHSVHVVTPHHDPRHCFTETRDGSIPVTIAGGWIPRSICGMAHALCACLRMIAAAVYLMVFSGYKPDVVFCDQVPACIPLLKLFRVPVLFYCHFPDLLLAQHDSYLRKVYRMPLDLLEQVTTGMANTVLVNSLFTANVFAETFPCLRVRPAVLYPSLNMAFFDQPVVKTVEEVLGHPLSSDALLVLSINRYERKKNLRLALRAFAELESCVEPSTWSRVHLVMAGGYDPRVSENVTHLDELRSLSSELGLSSRTTFLMSPDDASKLALLRRCTLLVYTPSKEHFGIVPLEAMYLRRPVVAVDSGGPRETVRDSETGFLRPPDASTFAVAMARLLENDKLAVEMGEKGRSRVEEEFSFEAFGNKLHQEVETLVGKKKEE